MGAGHWNLWRVEGVDMSPHFPVLRRRELPMALVVGIDLGRKSEHDALIFRRESQESVA